MATLGLSFVLVATALLVRVVSHSASYGYVPLRIPVLSSPIQDKTLSGFKEQPTSALEKTTVTVALTPKELLFGDLSSFTINASDVRSKFSVPHSDGSPQVDKMLSQIEEWKLEREKKLSIRSDTTLVLLPDSRVPMNIVIQVAHIIKKTGKYDNLILAGGLL